MRYNAAMPKADTPADRGTIAVVVKGWPRLSETFIARELRGLEARGLRLRLYSLRHPTDGRVHATAQALSAPVTYLPEYLWHDPARVWRGWRSAHGLPGYAAARRAWWRDLRRDPTPNRGRRFGQALVLAAELPPDVTHVYAHFLHTPASVARYTALMRGLTWSVSAHAKDIWTTPEWEKRDKLAEAAWVVTCTGAGHRHLQTLAPPRKVELIHHGIDAERYAPPALRPPRDGTDPDQPVTILSVGRAVPKKGFEDLLAALAHLPPERHWRLVHIGGGPLLASLQRKAGELGLSDRIEWRGSRDEDDVHAAYGEADLFALASRVTDDGDRDGIPNVIVEAMGRGLPVVATTAGAVPEIVSSDSGILVAPGDARAFAAALTGLIADPGRREARGRAGAARVRHDFPAARGLDRLAKLLFKSACVSPSTPR